ncbi:MAG: exodeoxyribonuclease V subunit beta [Pseudomonadota bacterium]
MAFTKFEIENTSLAGLHLIEASAGCGKTYALTSLFLRLLIEKNIPVNKILVVTFTNAATFELKERILERIRQAFKFLHKGEVIKDEYLASIVNNASVEGKINLKRAMLDFNDAQIFTIHGFCARVLQNFSLESGSLFEVDMITEQTNIIKELALDYYRKNIYAEHGLFVDYVLDVNFNIEDLIRLSTISLKRPEFKIIPKLKDEDTNEYEDKYKDAYIKLKSLYFEYEENIYDFIFNYKGLNRGKYRTSTLKLLLMQLHTIFKTDEILLLKNVNIEKLSASNMQHAINKGFEYHPNNFFKYVDEFCEIKKSLVSAFDKKLSYIKYKYLLGIKEDLKNKKQDNNEMFFDDLLIRLNTAINSDNNKHLTKAIIDNYEAALIDEFQDTDNYQYEIFNKLFVLNKIPLFLIGDPKQSIYSFRGADLYTYLEASKNASSKYTLQKNWRSNAKLTKAISIIWKDIENPFLMKDLTFHEVETRDNNDFCLTINKKTEAALEFYLLPNNEENYYIKSDAKELISQCFAQKIVNLLNKGQKKEALIDGKKVKPRDIAILVRENKEALLIQKALLMAKVPSIIFDIGNVFESKEASEFLYVLNAVLWPQNSKNIKTALFTDMLSYSLEDLDAMSEEKYLEIQERFESYNDILINKSFIKFYSLLLKQEKVLSKLAKLPNRKRRLVNLQHLSELLHKASLENKSHRMRLNKWLLEKIENPEISNDEHLLRLESDEQAVKILTIHKSKGLEFPIVFLPFLFHGMRKGKEILYYDQKQKINILDLNIDNDSSSIAKLNKQDLAENLRLLYVAMTRAKSKLYMVWGKIKGAESSALSYLLHCGKLMQNEFDLEKIEENYKTLSDDQLEDDLKKISENSKGLIAINRIGDLEFQCFSEQLENKEELILAKTKRTEFKNWRISSFSHLASENKKNWQLIEDNQANQPTPKEDFLESNIFTFPKGAYAGNFMHDIFENIDYSEIVEEKINTFAEMKLKAYNFDVKWVKIISKMIINVLSCQLSYKHEDLLLKHIKKEDKINELEFYFKAEDVNPHKFNAIFKKHETMINEIGFSQYEGFFTGFIDLIFRHNNKYYLLDWKSNYLGNELIDYNQASLTKCMIENNYLYQCDLYAYALHKYLGIRIKDYDYAKDFGGCFYMFLRGIDKDVGPDFGVFEHKPSLVLINELDNIFNE